MKTHALYPLMFHPVYKDTLWGGNTIARRYNRANTPHPCAESWELSALPGSESIVANGPFEGIGLDVLTQTFGRDLLGTKAPEPERFPLLIKLLDVHDRLSVQVHPDDVAALELGVRTKHELWYILDAAPGAEVWAGLTPGVTPETLLEHLQAYQTHPGDIFDLPAGIVHSAGPGNLIFEVQQASEAAYRIDDWGRGRELHPIQAAQCIRPAVAARHLRASRQTHRDLQLRLATPTFTFATLDLKRTRTLHTTNLSLMVLFCAEGKASLAHNGPNPLTLLPGDLVLIPPCQALLLQPLAAATRLLVTTL